MTYLKCYSDNIWSHSAVEVKVDVEIPDYKHNRWSKYTLLDWAYTIKVVSLF